MSTAITERKSPTHRYIMGEFSWAPIGVSVVLLAISLFALSQPSGTLSNVKTTDYAYVLSFGSP